MEGMEIQIQTEEVQEEVIMVPVEDQGNQVKKDILIYNNKLLFKLKNQEPLKDSEIIQMMMEHIT